MWGGKPCAVSSAVTPTGVMSVAVQDSKYVPSWQTLSKNVNLVTHAVAVLTFWSCFSEVQTHPLCSLPAKQVPKISEKHGFTLSPEKRHPWLCFCGYLEQTPQQSESRSPGAELNSWAQTCVELLTIQLCRDPPKPWLEFFSLEICGQQRNDPKKSMSLSPELVNLTLRWEMVLDDPWGQWHQRNPYKRKAGGLSQKMRSGGGRMLCYCFRWWRTKPQAKAHRHLQKLETVGNRCEKSAGLQVVSGVVL